MSKVQQLLEKALKLSPAERDELASRLCKSNLPDVPGEEISQEEWDRVWGDEIAARIERFERGETQARDAYEALADIRKQIHKARKK